MKILMMMHKFYLAVPLVLLFGSHLVWASEDVKSDVSPGEIESVMLQAGYYKSQAELAEAQAAYQESKLKEYEAKRALAQKKYNDKNGIADPVPSPDVHERRLSDEDYIRGPQRQVLPEPKERPTLDSMCVTKIYGSESAAKADIWLRGNEFSAKTNGASLPENVRVKKINYGRAGWSVIVSTKDAVRELGMCSIAQAKELGKPIMPSFTFDPDNN